MRKTPDVVWLVEGCQHSRLLLVRWGLLSFFFFRVEAINQVGGAKQLESTDQMKVLKQTDGVNLGGQT